MHLLRKGALLIGLLFALDARIAAAEPPRPQAVSPKDRAMELHDEAWTLYEQGRYRAAIEKLQAAVRMDPSGGELVYNLALLHEKLGELSEAETLYRRSLEMERDPTTRARVQTVLRRLEGARREQPIAAPVATVSSALPQQPSPPALRPIRTPVILATALAGGSLVAGSILGVVALASNPGNGARTGGGVTLHDLENDARTAHTEAIAADISLAMAMASAATAALLFFTTPPEPPASLVVVGPGFVGGRF